MLEDKAGVEVGTIYKFRGELVFSISDVPEAITTSKNA